MAAWHGERDWAGLIRRLRGLARRHEPVTGSIDVVGKVDTRGVFLLLDRDHAQVLSQFADRSDALRALARTIAADPDHAGMYGVQEFRDGEPVGAAITAETETRAPRSV